MRLRDIKRIYEMIGLGTQEKRNFFLKFKTEAVEKKYFILKTRDTSEFKKETL